MASERMKLGGLWEHEDKNGAPCFKGDFTFGTRLVIYKNGFKQKNVDPDYLAYLEPKKIKNTTKEEINEDDDIPI